MVNKPLKFPGRSLTVAFCSTFCFSDTSTRTTFSNDPWQRSRSLLSMQPGSLQSQSQGVLLGEQL